jgi:hypothetical protein
MFVVFLAPHQRNGQKRDEKSKGKKHRKAAEDSISPLNSFGKNPLTLTWTFPKKNYWRSWTPLVENRETHRNAIKRNNYT